MISAPSEIRCRSIPNICMIGNTTASVSGIESATTVPGPHAEADKAHGHDDRDRLPQRRREVADRVVDDMRLIRDQYRLDADRQIGLDLAHRLLDVSAKGQDVAAFAHRDGNSDGRLSVDPEHRLRRVGIIAAHLGDVAQPDHAPVRYEIDRQDVLFGLECARDPQQQPLVAGLNDRRPG